MVLVALKQTGQCEVFLPESFFDADYPGHYLRRLKSVSLTLPCVVGPYTSINCTLTLLSNKTRVKPIMGKQYKESIDEEDDRFVANFAAMQSIATSNAQNDSGLFELNFRDERYLPFEGAGAISRWRIELPRDTNAFDLNTLTDVVMHLKYTARDGGEILKNAARNAINELISDAEGSPLMRSFSARHEFPDAWYRFLRPADQNAISQQMTLDVSIERFPYLFRGRQISISSLDMFLIFADLKDTAVYAGAQPLALTITPEGQTAIPGQLQPGVLAGTPHLEVAVDVTAPTSLTLEVKEDDVKKIAKTLTEPTASNHVRLNTSRIEDIFFVAHYSVAG
jgi:hypothetical protein